MVALDSRAPADTKTPGRGLSRARHALLIGALTLVAMGGVLWQADQSGAVAQKGELPKLLCPLH